MIDTHCHLDLYSNPSAVAREAMAKGVRIIAVTNLPSHFRLGRPYVSQLRGVRLALGLHPLLADDHEAELELFHEYLKLTSYIGEVGLDFSREGRRTRKKQLSTFRYILTELKDHQKFVSLHSRGAEAAVLEHLQEFNRERAVFHWFSGPSQMAERVAEAGHYFSVNPAMVRSRSGRDIIRALPPDRILTETDGPYVRVAGRPVRPHEVSIVVDFLTATWGQDGDKVRERVMRNFRGVLAVAAEKAEGTRQPGSEENHRPLPC